MSKFDPAAMLNTPFEPVRRPLLYVPALLVVAMLMVLLPLVYLGLAAGVGFLVYLHAVHNTAIFDMSGAGRAVIYAGLLYCAPIAAGATVVFFMIKPFFAPASKTHGEPYSLPPHEQKKLYDYVNQLCLRLGAPMPSQINVDCQANASAGPTKGLFSILRRDLALTIGLPLVLGMDVRQLSGVLAHEFGHFTQGAAMASWYVINSINSWFARVVYQRDAWDEALENATSEGGHILIILLVLFVRLCVWFSRRILWLFMTIAHVMSSFLSRQMEYDADRFEVRIAGSEHFEPTSRAIIALDVAFHAAAADIQDAWSRRELPDDLPRLIVSSRGKHAAQIHGVVDKSIVKGKTGPLDTHPSMKARFKHAMREGSPGIINVDAPASVLFEDLGDICRRASYLHYRAVLGERVMDATFVNTAEVVTQAQSSRDEMGALSRLWPHSFHEQRTFWPNAVSVGKPTDPKATLKALRDARQKLAGLQPKDLIPLYRALREANEARRWAVVGDSFVRAKITLDMRKAGMSKSTREAAAEAASNAEIKLAESLDALSTMESLVRTRLMSALELLYAREIVERIEGGVDARTRAGEHLSLLESLRLHEPTVDRLIGSLMTINAVRASISSVPSAKAMEELQRLAESVKPIAARVEKILASVGKKSAPVQASGVDAVVQTCAEAIETYYATYATATGKLAVLCEQVEAALKLDPMKEITLPSIVTQ